MYEQSVAFVVVRCQEQVAISINPKATTYVIYAVSISMVQRTTGWPWRGRMTKMWRHPPTLVLFIKYRVRRTETCKLWTSLV